MGENMKARLAKLFNIIKNKSIIIGGISLSAIFIVIGICFFYISHRSVTVSNTASKGELTKESVKTTEETKEETKTDTDKIITEQQSEENMETIEESTTENIPQNVTAGEVTENSPQINSNAGADTGALRVSGTNLTDSNGNIVQLKGVSTHGIAWFPDYINNACFKQLHEEFGINVIRLAMYTAEYNGYCTGGDRNYLKGLIDNGVKYAAENNMYVIIDWHILSDGNPNTYIDDAKVFFEEMSSKYSSYTNVIYEICNEPNGGTTWNEIKSYATQIIEVIRRNDKNGVIIVGTPNWSQYVNEAAGNPITGYDNIMYALHFYAATHTDDLRNVMVQAVNSGLPIFVSEFGICDASGNGGIDEVQSGKWINLLNQYGISYVMWSLCNKSETAAMINSACNKTSGYSVDDLSASGKWFLKLMTGGLNLSQYNEVTDNPQQSGGQQGNTNQNNNQSNHWQTDNEQNSNTQNNNTQNSNTQTAQKVTVKAEPKLVTQWEANGTKFYQYEVTVTNNSGKACGSWSTDINFAGNIKLSDSWNGKYTVNGAALHIESADYNGALGIGESTGNIGFIISGNGNLK